VLRLHKVLELELRRGADDGAVIGGIDRFLANARSDKNVEALLNGAPALPHGYHALDVAQRQIWIRQALEAKPAARPSEKKVASKAAKPKPAATAPSAISRTPPPSDPLDSPVTAIRGIKDALQAKLARLGVFTVRDLLYLFPNRHNDYANVRKVRDLVPDEEQTAQVSVYSSHVARLGFRPGTEATLGDETGTMRVVWFNQPYLAEQLRTNDRIVIAGKVGIFNGKKTMENPEWERVDDGDLTHTGRLVPVYPLTAGLSQRVLRRSAKDAVDRFVTYARDALPAPLRERLGMPGLQDALRAMHYPETKESHDDAHERMAFEELLRVQLAVLERRRQWQDGRSPAFDLDGTLETYRAALPFELTRAQQRVLGDIMADLQLDRPMARLLQGDVGSGKTAVAAAALTVAVANGYQGALMAPTEILAEQHYRTLAALLAPVEVNGRPMRVELLTGSLTGARKRGVAAAMASGEIDIAVGTHALIQEGVSFRKLGVAVVDEQHRFGVMQRAALRERMVDPDAPDQHPVTPHLLVMSATPIPRTLALTFFGDLDVSVIDELPPGRKPIVTKWVGPEDRGQAYSFVRDEVRQGRQAFVVCPLIDESPALQSRAATIEYERLSSQVFPELRLGLLHGRMAASEKEAVLQAFRRGDLHILVATTVIEVGIDIPNASVMLIEGADRFGLAQLHQLRGRVGRGAEQSYCLLLSDDPSMTARQRLQLLEDNNDGFALAEADLKLRGPGDIVGTRQSGIPELQTADFSDVGLIETARREAMALLAEDPGLEQPEHALLREAVDRAKRVVTGEVG
jgi:ATP-dependent DNA helicase RecG